MSEVKSVYSMTGYGRGSAALGAINLSVECKSLNSRHLEVSCKLPRIHSALETELRQLVQSQVARGRVELLVVRKVDAVMSEEGAARQLAILADSKRKLTELECQYSSLGITIDNQLRFDIAKNLINNSTSVIEEDLLTDLEVFALKKAVTLAIEQLQKQRKEEGERLLKDLSERLFNIRTDAVALTSMAVELPKIIREKVSERVKASLASVAEIDQSRLLQEIVLLVDKADVTEELVRLDSHIQLFNDTLCCGGLVGKKLDFVCQEIFRELNTLGGKSGSAEMQAIVVNCKVELERIREQVQNLE